MKTHQVTRTTTVRSAITMDQVFAAERLDSAGFDRVLAAVNSGDKATAAVACATLEAKLGAGYILTPMTRELLDRAQEVLDVTALH